MSKALAPPSYFKWWVCVLLLLASTLNYMDRQALSQTGLRIKSYFELSNFQFSNFESAFNIAFALGALSIGYLADRGNIRVIYPVIVILWSIAGFAAGFAESFVFLLICRFALGLFEAGNIPCGVLTVKRVLKPEERALGNGMFQSGTALGAIITPMVVLACVSFAERIASSDAGFAWQLPFRVIGAIGVVWAIAWLLTVKSHHLRAPASVDRREDTYWSIFRNRRFWVSLIVVLSINSAWRSFVYWLPTMLQEDKRYTEVEMSALATGFYVAADLGSIAAGAAVLGLFRGGMPLARARLLVYTGCAGLTTLTLLLAVLPRGVSLVTILFLLGFGALGVFPIYFALSQEISVRHQGKVTGTLSFLNAIYLAGYIGVQGFLSDVLGSIALVLCVTGLFPLIGLVALAVGWREAPKVEPPNPG
jgi:ACS family hexuronate transporter-like MFS transporter